MREDLNREKMHKAIDSSFSGLNGDPWLFQRVSARAAEGEIHMKKKLSAGLVLAIVLILLAAAAVAVTLLTHQEIMEQVAVPMALENDEETIGVNPAYSREQLAEIVRILNENGITFEENSDIMQHLQNGLGYYEESLFSQICRIGFGGDYDSWTPEQRSWYDEMEYRMGQNETIQPHEPGEENMSREEAETVAFAKLREEYRLEMFPEDRDCWQLSLAFCKSTEEGEEDCWIVSLWPKDLVHGYYSICFNDREPHEIIYKDSEAVDWNKTYTGEELLNAYTYVYGYQGDWPQSVWQAFHEDVLKAEPDPETRLDAAYTGYKLTSYPEPEASEVSREEAIRIAKEAVELERIAFNGAVLTEYEGERTWLVNLVIHEPLDDTEDEEAGRYIVSIDSVSGTVRNVRKFMPYEDNYAMFYTPEAAYEKTIEGELRQSRMLPLAVAAFREEYSEFGDPLDEKEFAVADHSYNEPYLSFKTRNPKHGGFSVWFNPDGTVDSVAIDLGPMTGENLFRRYWEAYGWFGEWDQSRWVQLEADMRKLEPTTINNKVIKATHYPEESSVSIGHEEAQRLGLQVSGRRTAQVNTCVLVDAEPHPVWIMEILSMVPTTVVGIDAETGETVFNMNYNHNVTPDYVFYSLPETWRKMELEMKGAPYVAERAVIDRYTPQETHMLDYDYMEDGYNWDLEVDGLTVRYTGRWKGVKSYEVELDENGNVLRCEETESEATEEKPKEEIWEQPWIWKNAAAPDAYWEQLEAALAKNGVDAGFGNLPDKLVEWTQQYGAFSKEAWPSDLYAIGYVLTKIRPSDLAAGTVTFPEIYETK